MSTSPHHDNRVNWTVGAIDFVWPYFLGGCSITRDSGKCLREAGTWHKVDLRQPEGEPSYMDLPHVTGILTK